jgi:hypothetical protein
MTRASRGSGACRSGLAAETFPCGAKTSASKVPGKMFGLVLVRCET